MGREKSSPSTAAAASRASRAVTPASATTTHSDLTAFATGRTGPSTKEEVPQRNSPALEVIRYSPERATPEVIQYAPEPEAIEESPEPATTSALASAGPAPAASPDINMSRKSSAKSSIVSMLRTTPSPAGNTSNMIENLASEKQQATRSSGGSGSEERQPTSGSGPANAAAAEALVTTIADAAAAQAIIEHELPPEPAPKEADAAPAPEPMSESSPMALDTRHHSLDTELSTYSGQVSWAFTQDDDMTLEPMLSCFMGRSGCGVAEVLEEEEIRTSGESLKSRFSKRAPGDASASAGEVDPSFPDGDVPDEEEEGDFVGGPPSATAAAVASLNATIENADDGIKQAGSNAFSKKSSCSAMSRNDRGQCMSVTERYKQSPLVFVPRDDDAESKQPSTAESSIKSSGQEMVLNDEESQMVSRVSRRSKMSAMSGLTSKSGGGASTIAAAVLAKLTRVKEGIEELEERERERKRSFSQLDHTTEARDENETVPKSPNAPVREDDAITATTTATTRRSKKESAGLALFAVLFVFMILGVVSVLTEDNAETVVSTSLQDIPAAPKEGAYIVPPSSTEEKGVEDMIAIPSDQERDPCPADNGRRSLAENAVDINKDAGGTPVYFAGRKVMVKPRGHSLRKTRSLQPDKSGESRRPKCGNSSKAAKDGVMEGGLAENVEYMEANDGMSMKLN